MYVSYDRFSEPLPLYTPVHILDESFSIPPVAHVCLPKNKFLNQRTNKNIRISYSLKYTNIQKKKKNFCEKINGSVRWYV